MKTNSWLILGTMIATSALAQVNTGQPNAPAIPAPASPAAPAAVAPVPAPAEPVLAPVDTKTNAPAKKTVKARKKAGKKAKAAAKHKVESEKAEGNSSVKLAEKKASETALAVPLVAGPATVAADNVNLRGQAGLQGEVVGHVKKGDTVTVLAEITLDKPKAGEPAQWAKISLPADEKVWINSKYIDPGSKVVTATKLNLRGGPGENYSVLGVIEKGTAVTAITTKEAWLQIETPASAFAFVSASLLKQEPAGANVPAQPPVVAAETPQIPPPAAPPATPPPAPPTPTIVAEAPPVAPPAAAPPTEPPQPTITSVTPEPAAPETTTSPVVAAPSPTLAPDNDTNLPPPPPREVAHQGSVRHSVSLVAPTYFELYDPASDKAIDYLYTTTTNLNLQRYDGLEITVSGKEAMDPRWKDTPVLTVEKIYVVGPSPDTIRTPPRRIGRPR